MVAAIFNFFLNSSLHHSKFVCEEQVYCDATSYDSRHICETAPDYSAKGLYTRKLRRVLASNTYDADYHKHIQSYSR